MVGAGFASLRGHIRALFIVVVAAISPMAEDAHGRLLGEPSVSIPSADRGSLRLIRTEDLARIRDIDALSLSPDGSRFAILVRQADPDEDAYRTAWYTGSTDGGALIYVGDGGEARLLIHANGMRTGDFDAGLARWSPDGRTIAYAVQRGGERQLWTSRADGRGSRQITRNASDVMDFGWSEDGRTIYFEVGAPRSALRARARDAEREGHLLQSFRTLYDAVNPGEPEPPQTQPVVWVVDASGRRERVAAAADAAFAAIRDRLPDGGGELSAALRPPAIGPGGALAWLERDNPAQTGMLPFARLRAAMTPGGDAVICEDPRCGGQIIRDIWWRGDGEEVVFASLDGPTDMRQSVYAWSPSSGAVRTLFSSLDQSLTSCAVANSRLFCLRETMLEPRHVAAIDLDTGAVAKIADVNPEFARLRLGRAEWLEWDSAPDVAGMGYAPRAGGALLYPPDYDPSRSYPLFVAPYGGGGFLRGDVGDEHPLLVYAANGFVVLNSRYPHAIRQLVESDANVINQRAYDPAFDYPHLTMLSETALRGVDAAAARANIDPARIGTGGVSHGAFVPLYTVQKHDRFAALSVAQGSWQDLEYHFARLPFPYGEQPQPMFPKDESYWDPIDLRRHLDKIEAPVLFHVAAGELVGMARLLRAMSDARLPFEAFNFNDETHLKWRPAHRLSIYNRNLDWFRFWLLDVEDPDPAKTEQYERWRRLRELQCQNPRSMRDYCSVGSAFASTAQ